MKIRQVEAHVLKNQYFDNWDSIVSGKWTVEDLRSDVNYCNDWISFDSLAWDEQSKKLYIGLTSINTDIFHVFDPSTKQFHSLDFQRISNKFDAKFHRSLEIDGDGIIYAATALLHDQDQQHQAPGGKLIRYNPKTDLYKVLDIPVPHHYIQSIKLDPQRRLIYGFTYPGEYLFKFDLETQKTKILAYIGNAIMMCQPHSSAIDSQGRLWGTWGETRAFEDSPGPTPIQIFCYDPDKDQFSWFKHGFPRVNQNDFARIDTLLSASDGFIYAGSVAGGFSRLNPQDGSVENLGSPYPGARLAGLAESPEGLIFGAGNSGYGEGNKGEARLFVFDPKSNHLKDLGKIYDPQIDMGAVKIHMLVMTADGTLYAGENDNIYRSSYLWEIKVGD
ncbi:MAG: hypothetical protein RBT05_02945 [Bacteroidales bacterium]|nr:hypothetical protein [Bacteroidales bacterium]